MRIIISSFMMLLLSGCMEMCSQPTETKLFLPKDTEGTSVKVNDPKSVLTLILGADSEIFYYTGELKDAQVQKTSFKGVREVIINNKKIIKPDEFVVLIKPGAGASYQNTVDILDEMSINDIKRYALVDLTKEEADISGVPDKK